MSNERGAGRLTRQERKIDIVVHMLFQAFAVGDEFAPEPIGVYEIARRIGLKPTAYLRGILMELWDEDCISVEEGRAANGSKKYFYTLRSAARWMEPYRSRIDEIIIGGE